MAGPDVVTSMGSPRLVSEIGTDEFSTGMFRCLSPAVEKGLLEGSSATLFMAAQTIRSSFRDSSRRQIR